MKIKNQILYFVSILMVALTTFSCTDDTQSVVKLSSIVDIAKANPDFSILVDALNVTGLATTLSGNGSFTVFAPTNAAFTAAGYTSAKIKGWNPLVPADATEIANLKLKLQNHVLGLGTVTSDLIAVGYSKTFGYYKATATATSGIALSLYVAQVGSDVLVNGGALNGGAKITTPNVDASNGVIQVVDAVLALPTIVNQIAANPDLVTLLGVVKSTPQASVLATLNAATNLAPITVYAPNNAAFATALGTGGYLVGKTDAQITSILNYHLEKGNKVAASATSYNATADVTVATLFVPQTFVITKGTVKIVDKSNPAVNGTIKVINIQGTNGVVQIIDKVLQPLLP